MYLIFFEYRSDRNRNLGPNWDLTLFSNLIFETKVHFFDFILVTGPYANLTPQIFFDSSLVTITVATVNIAMLSGG